MILAERYLYPRWLAHDRLGSRAAHSLIALFTLAF